MAFAAGNGRRCLWPLPPEAAEGAEAHVDRWRSPQARPPIVFAAGKRRVAFAPSPRLRGRVGVGALLHDIAARRFPTSERLASGFTVPIVAKHRSMGMREGQKRDAARGLRRNMTDAEQKLWRHLRHRQLAGHRFRRQCPIGPYIVDFVCLERRLVVEVDGGQHAGSARDLRRDGWLGAQGFLVLRFWNNEVLEQIEGVCDMILESLSKPPHSGLPPQAGDGDMPPRAGRRGGVA